MREQVKPRFAVDLDEIERQLAHAQSAPAPAAYASGSPTPSRSDPLAELARIVGQDDPFQSMLSSDRTQRVRVQEPGGADDLFEAHAGRAAPGLRGSSEPAYAAPAAYEPHEAHQDQYDPSYEQPYYDPQEEAPAAEDLAPPPRTTGRRKSAIAVGAVLGAAVIGLGGAFALKGQGSLLPSGDPPLIKAANEPIKVAPQSPGGIEIPNQNKQIYERAQEGQTKVVSREEQPVDVRQAVRTPSTDPAGTGSTQVSTNSLNLGEPRRVRTVSIRPDGTIINPDSVQPPPPRPAPQQTASLQLPSAIPAAPSPAPVATPAAAPTPAPRAAAPATPAPRAAAPMPTPTSPGDASPQSQAQSSATPAAKPAPAPAPAAPAPQRVASATPSVPAQAQAPTATEAVAAGGFSVQLGVSASEADAKTTLQKMQSKYADLGGRPGLIRKAEVNGNTVFRVRVGPMARDEASSLCSKIQGQGGQCFVAKN